MAKKLFTTSYLSDIANSIRNKLGVANNFKISEMSSAIDSIIIKEQPQLYSPSISISEDILTITPSENNGAFNDGSTFIIYVDEVAYVGDVRTTYDLIELTGHIAGRRIVKVIQCREYFQNSNYSNDVYWDTIGNSLRITANGGNLKVKLAIYKVGGSAGLSEAPEIYYRKSNETGWTLWLNSKSVDSSEITLNSGEFMTLLNVKGTLGNNANAWVYLSFSDDSTGNAIATGNIMSMLNNVETMPEYALNRLFYNATKLTLLHNDSLSRDKYLTLPRTNLTARCYTGLFMYAGITELPKELPAIIMANYCYSYMFAGCPNLASAISPALLRNITTLAEACFYYMFSNSNLAICPVLPDTTIMERYCYQYMFAGTKINNAPMFGSVMTLADGCFAGMFENCSRLNIGVMTLPSGTIPASAYYRMFADCPANISLPIILSITKVEYRGMYQMFANNASLNVGKIAETGANEVFTLPTSLETDALIEMFNEVPTYHATGWVDGTPNAGETIYYKS